MFRIDIEKRPIYALLIRILGFLIGFTALVLQVVNNMTISDQFMINHSWAFFTIQSNFLCVLLFLYLIIMTIISYFKTKKLEIVYIKPIVHLGITFYITITLIVFWLILAPGVGVGYKPLPLASNLFLHLFTPVITIIDAFLFMKHGRLNHKECLKWLIYPILYYIFTVIVSYCIKTPYYNFKFNGNVYPLMYPYPFLDPQVMSPMSLVVMLAVILSLMTGLGLLFIYLDDFTAKRIIKRNNINNN